THIHDIGMEKVQIARLMLPDDANTAGNVHGGTLLKMIEEAGAIITTRFCNDVPDKDSFDFEPSVTTLARVERTDFINPVHIGNVVQIVAEITYASSHSLECSVSVWGEDILKGVRKLTNRAVLWFVPCSINDPTKIMTVPEMHYSSEAEKEAGLKRYNEQKKARTGALRRNKTLTNMNDDPYNNNEQREPEPYSPRFARSVLIHMIGVSDCTLQGFARGGVIMKLMDECAGLVAKRHCRTPAVTASLDAINFHKKMRLGQVVTIVGQPLFTSNKSMEIEVQVTVESITGGQINKDRACDAFFTFVSLDKQGKPLPTPQLKLQTLEEQQLFEEGKLRYEARKKLRKTNQKSSDTTKKSNIDKSKSATSHLQNGIDVDPTVGAQREKNKELNSKEISPKKPPSPLSCNVVQL
ncbi:unnamed protein product, partial [Owenia fusiformis]